jgi:Fe-S-cluster containining protein
MGKKTYRRGARSQRKQSAAQADKPKQDARAETIATAMSQAVSPAGRAQIREHIEECGSPVVAARDVFFAYAEAAEEADPRYAVACRAGCWFCCTTPVGVTVFEAAMVKSAVLTLPEAEQQAIWQRLQAHIEAQSTALAEASEARASFHRRCPLLNDAGTCSVYEGRPLACRGLLSLDADRCRRSFLEGDAGDRNVPFVLTNNAAVSGVPHLMMTLNEGQLDHYPNYELASALFALWTKPESFVAWQQGQRFATQGFPLMAEGSEIFRSPEGLPIGPSFAAVIATSLSPSE